MIDVTALTVTRGHRTVLDDVSLSIGEGTFVGLVGPNGAGKTTLLQTINGVLSPDDGTVTVDGQHVSESSAREISRLVATVPQDGSVAFEFPVRDVVAMGRMPYQTRFGRPDAHSDREHVERALDRTETAEFAARPVTDISGGQRQRVLLARALAQDTPTLLLDEPTANLDINHQIRTLSLVADLVADGKTAVAAIHDLNLAARFCDRLVMLADESILASGPPANVLETDALGNAFGTTTAVGTDPLTGTPSVTALPDRQPQDVRVHVVGSGPVGATVLSRLHDAGLSLSAGPVPTGDVVLETTRGRNIETATVPPLEKLDPATRAQLGEYLDVADVTVLADPPLDQTDSVLDHVAEAEAIVVVGDDEPKTAANPPRHAEKGTERLPERAVATDQSDVVDAVLATAADRAVPADD